jgi:phospholipase C
MPVDRRTLLRTGLSVAGLSALPASIARALAIPADVRTGTIEDVQHVVILMQENRAFDHYFGTFPGVCGFGDRFPIPVAPGPDGSPRTVWTQLDRTAVPPRAVHPFHLSTQAQFVLMRMEGTPHHWPNAQAAWDHGRMGHWPEAKTQRAMGYYTREDLPFQFALAEAFTLCDAYHCSVQTGTNTNRLFLWSATNDPHGRAGGPVIDNVDDSLDRPDSAQPRYHWTTYGERLQAAGIDWRHYQDMADNFGDNPVQNFLQYRRAHRGEPGSDLALKDRALSTQAIDRLKADVLAGTLPQVSWVIGTAEGSEHPGPSSPAQGAAYTAQVIDALTADPKVWSRTVLFVMFDENDGFFDHVPPPAPPSPDPDAPGGWAGASSIDTDREYHRLPAPGAEEDELELRGRPYGLGPRVPMYVLSPWSRGGWVHSEVADHTSVLRFLERRFGVMEPNISPWRRAVCGDLTGAFDFARPNFADFAAVLPDMRFAREAARAIQGQVAPQAPEAPLHPAQERGVRLARPLPYRLEVHDGIDLASGRAPGVTLTANWLLDGEEGSYDLWVRGPNGFHRHFAGDRATSRAIPALDWTLAEAALTLSLSEGAPALCVAPAAYADHHPAWSAPAGPARQRWSLAATGGWYDLVLTSDAHPLYRRRLAGRLEDGRPGITDPARA